MEKEKEFYRADYLLALGYKSGRQNESKVQVRIFVVVLVLLSLFSMLFPRSRGWSFDLSPITVRLTNTSKDSS